MAFEAMESALVVAAYSALGQSVSYVGQGADTVTIYAIVDNGAELLGFNSETSEDVARARVKASDVSKPRRGDRIELADGTVYVIDSVDRENNVEWSMTMTERDR